jgi:putative aldouronate transport system substrate-binding protein
MKRVLSVLLAVVMLLSVFAGCGSQSADTKVTESKTDASAETAAPAETKAEAPAPSIDDSKIKDPYGLPNDYSAYPVKGNPSITMWWPIDTFQAVAIKDMNEHEVWKEIQKLTGVKVKFIHPAVGQEADQVNLMIASGDIPDIIVQSGRYKGGVTAGIADGVYVDHKDIIEKYSPNYKKFRESDDSRRKTTMNDQGQILGYYNLSPYSEWIWFGLLIKQEAIDKTGLPVPETVDDWYAFLKKCKEVGYDQPLNYGSNYGTIFTGLINGAFGAWDWTFKDKDGKVAWGPVQPGMREYLQVIAKWNKEGLLNKDWATADFNQRMAVASSNSTAAMMDSPDTMWGVWKTQHNIDFIGAPYPVLKKGDKPQSTYLHNKNCGWETSITTSCKNVEAVARFMDFGYTKKGWELFNFGLEGRTHEMNDKGMPYYPDNSIMYNDPDKIPLSNLVFKYKLHQGPFIREEHNSNPMIVAKGSYSGKIRQQWQEGTSYDFSLPSMTLTPEEATREAELGTQLATLRSETFSKIVMGQKPITTYDEFLKKAKQLGLDEFLSIWQKAYDRYNAR